MMSRHMPEALGKYVVIKLYVDAIHAGIVANRRSHSFIIIYVNKIPIIWYSKKIAQFGIQVLYQSLLLLGFLQR